MMIFYWTTVAAFVSLTLLMLWLDWRKRFVPATILDRLLVNQEKIMALVKIEDGDLAAFAGAVQAQVATINSTVAELGSYISQLLANQATPLPDADETAINKALADLSAATGGLNALDAPVAAPDPAPVDPAPVDVAPVDVAPVDVPVDVPVDAPVDAPADPVAADPAAPSL